MRVVRVSCRGPLGVWPLLLLAGIRSEIVPPPQYTHHNRLLYPQFPFRPFTKHAYPFNARTMGISSISTLRPNLTLHPLRGYVGILETLDASMYGEFNFTQVGTRRTKIQTEHT